MSNTLSWHCSISKGIPSYLSPAEMVLKWVVPWGRIAEKPWVFIEFLGGREKLLLGAAVRKIFIWPKAKVENQQSKNCGSEWRQDTSIMN